MKSKAIKKVSKFVFKHLIVNDEYIPHLAFEILRFGSPICLSDLLLGSSSSASPICLFDLLLRPVHLQKI